MPGVVVIDASIAVKWTVHEPDSDTARALGRTWRRDSVRVVAPHIIFGEVSNALHQRVRRNQLTTNAAAELLQRFGRERLELHHSIPMYERAVEIASRLHLGAIYDSLYLALAESLDCEYWTADTRFARAAREQFDFIRVLADFAPRA